MHSEIELKEDILGRVPIQTKGIIKNDLIKVTK